MIQVLELSLPSERYCCGELAWMPYNFRRVALRHRFAAGLMIAKSFDEVGEDLPSKTDAEKRARDEVRAFVADILFSPIVKRVLCGNSDKISFAAKNRISARLNRSELGEYDALVLGFLLMTQFKGQLVIPDFGFYGRDIHTSLIRENRLVAGVNFLAELSPKLQRTVLLIKDKEGRGAMFEDAEMLAKSRDCGRTGTARTMNTIGLGCCDDLGS